MEISLCVQCWNLLFCSLLFTCCVGILIRFCFLFSLIVRYKILFLDVLFPLHVKKIIFVDADLVRIFLWSSKFLNSLTPIRTFFSLLPFRIPITLTKIHLPSKTDFRKRLPKVSISPNMLKTMRGHVRIRGTVRCNLF